MRELSRKEKTEFNKLQKRLRRNVGNAIVDYNMIEAGDRVMVCLSGGKDSYTLLAVLHELQWRGLLPVDLLACNLDQGQPGFPATVLPDFLERMGVPHRIEYQDTYSIVVDKVLAANPGQVAEYRAGKEKLIGFFVGQVMKETKGQANPGQVNQILKEKLSG